MIVTRTMKMTVLAAAAAVAGSMLIGWWSEQPRRDRESARFAHPERAANASDLGDRGETHDAGAIGEMGLERSLAATQSPPKSNGAGAPRELDVAPIPSAVASAPKAAPNRAASTKQRATRAASTRQSSGRSVLRRANVDLSASPLYFTGAFDGSRRFGMWAETMQRAREIAIRHGKAIHFTYFINTCYYDTTTEGSIIGKAESAAEVLVRRALTQQAINEGHEIASHAVRHRDGSAWSAEEWRKELAEFHAVAAASFFEPLRDEDGEPVFPRFQPAKEAAPGATGAACSAGADCASGRCLEVTSDRRFCTEGCNQARPCPSGTACGTPDYSEDTDVCVPIPEYPIHYLGAELFDAEGRPNRARPELVPYRLVGFRAPFLGYNDALLEVLLDLGYLYDASQILDPGPPLRVSLQGAADRSLFELGLAQHAGARTIPMDFNYLSAGADGERMKADYRQSLIFAYGPGRRSPWNVGHHFALWRDGEYWRAMQDAISFAAEGCPGERGERLCADVELPSFRELAMRLAEEEGRRQRTSSGNQEDGSTTRPKPRFEATETHEPH